jgi:hypothetical protein
VAIFILFEFGSLACRWCRDLEIQEAMIKRRKANWMADTDIIDHMTFDQFAAEMRQEVKEEKGDPDQIELLIATLQVGFDLEPESNWDFGRDRRGELRMKLNTEMAGHA